ncbi:acetylcholine receptor subunit beta-type unc-29-like isoform X2 [Symsagittifera roscoffensis]|uniref:acetylcholine receptor subunit beta-type unc-29-like isoform X2 n=1 Tax=Symsagittifera roscoffensis TaxID=84072 RepID=UPI00307B7176
MTIQTMRFEKAVGMILELLFFLSISGLCTQGDQHRIFEDIIESKPHLKNLRPVLQQTTPTIVTMDTRLTEIVDLDETNGKLTTNWVLNMSWTDELLSWSTNNYGQEGEIVVPAGMIWIPDITVQNSEYDIHSGLGLFRDCMARVKNNGLISVVTQLHLKTTCTTDGTFFPYDSQTCTVSFASQVYTSEELYMQNQSAQSAHDSMKISAHWEILGVFVDSLRQHYASIRFQIHVRRKMTFHSKLWSSFFATFALISLSIFLLPCDAIERSTLGVVNIAIQLVVMMLAASNLPQGEEGGMPWIGVFLSAQFLIAIASLVAHYIVIKIGTNGIREPNTSPPDWLKKLAFNWLRMFGSRIVEATGANQDDEPRIWAREDFADESKSQTEPSKRRLTVECPNGSGYVYNLHVNTAWDLDEQTCKTLPIKPVQKIIHETASTTPSEIFENSSLFGMPTTKRSLVGVKTSCNSRQERLASNELLENIDRNLSHFVVHLNLQRQIRIRRNEWSRIAQIINRFLLFLFLVTNVAVSSFILGKLMQKL